MRKSVVVLLMLVCAVSMIYAQGQSASQEAEKTYVFKFAHSMSEESARHKSMVFFKEELEKRSDGRITVEIYANGILGSESEVMDMVKTNSVQGTRGSQFEKANPKYLIYNMPFLFNTSDEFKQVLQSSYEDGLAQGAQANGYYIPATGIAGGYRQFTNNIRPIETPDDIKGLKMRTPPLEPVLKALDALGANPQQVPYKETYMALKTGVVDGQENPYSNIYDMKFHEVQKYLSVSNYIICPDCFFVSDLWFEQLPEDLQSIFTQVAKEAMILSTDTWLAAEEDYRAELAKALTINKISSENLAKFRDKMGPVWEYFIKKGSFTQTDLDQLNTILADYR